MLKVVGLVALGVVGFLVVSAMFGPSPDAVSDRCRKAVGLAAVDVDAWRYIQGQCSDQERQALIREFQRRGLSTAEIERSRAARPAA